MRVQSQRHQRRNKRELCVSSREARTRPRASTARRLTGATPTTASSRLRKQTYFRSQNQDGGRTRSSAPRQRQIALGQGLEFSCLLLICVHPVHPRLNLITCLFTDYLNQYTFLAPAVKLTVKDLFPRSEV